MLRHAHPADHLLLLARERALTARQLARIDGHVATCNACKQRYARLQSALFALAGDDDVIATSATADMAAARLRLRNALRDDARRPAALWRRYVGNVVHTFAVPLACAAAVFVAAFLTRTLDRHAMTTLTFEVSGTGLPVATLTPGAVSNLTAEALCAGQRPSRVVTQEIRAQVLVDYGMGDVSRDAYELDALVTPELGGTAARANVWPQRYSAMWNAHVKDALENLLAAQVCLGETPLTVAQHELAGDWVAAYKRYFQTDTPIAEHVAALELDDDLIVEGVTPARADLSDSTRAAMRAAAPIRSVGTHVSAFLRVVNRNPRMPQQGKGLSKRRADVPVRASHATPVPSPT